MYLYVYDAFVQEKKYEKELQKVENRLTDLGIAGKIVRLGLFRRADEFIRDEVRRSGVTTVVAVGDDTTVRQVIDVAVEAKAVLGIIPFGQHNRLATLLGVPAGETACDILSARIIETVDTGVVNNKRFVREVEIPAVKAEINCEDRYKILPQGRGTIYVRNLATDSSFVSDPLDGRLEIVIEATDKSGGWKPWAAAERSVIPLNSFSIRTHEPIQILIDGVPSEGSRFDFSVEAKILKVITGKERKF